MNKDVKPENQSAEASVPATPVDPVEKPKLADTEEPHVEKTDDENKERHDEDLEPSADDANSQEFSLHDAW